MTVLEIVNELEKNGKLKAMMRSGFISAKVIHYREVYLYVDAQTRLNPNTSKDTIITWACDTFKVTKKTIYNALNAFK